MVISSLVPSHFLTNLNLIRIVLPTSVEVVVASSGGVGTTFLLRHLALYKQTNHIFDDDGIKHSPLPPIAFNRNSKFVYIYGNPQTAAISLFRRNFHHLASIKSQKFERTNVSPIPQNMTLQEYADRGIDKFHFRNHFYNWYDKYLSVCPTMFVRYETIFDNVDSLVEFLDLPKDCVDSFPKKKKRASTIAGIPLKTRQQLNLMYGNLSDEFEKLDDVEIRQRTSQKSRAMTYLTSPYLNSIVEQPAIELKLLLRQAQSGMRRFSKTSKSH